MLVIDASVLVAALVDDGRLGAAAQQRLRDEDLAAPELVDVEVLSVFRGLVRGGHLSVIRARQSLVDLARSPLTRVSHLGLLPRCWELRDNLTTYDATYVALAELLDAVLLTADARLARAPGPRCSIEVLQT